MGRVGVRHRVAPDELLRAPRRKKIAGPRGSGIASSASFFVETDRSAEADRSATWWAYFRFFAFFAVVFFFAVLRAAGFFAAIERFLVALRAFLAIALSS
jgi:hypothetical protein